MEGYVYVLVNESFHDNVKIGKTKDSPSYRAACLSQPTSVPTPFIVAYAPRVTDHTEAERRIHLALADRRDRTSEFFRVSPTEAIHSIIEHCFDLIVPFHDRAAIEQMRLDQAPTTIDTDGIQIDDIHNHMLQFLHAHDFDEDVIVSEWRSKQWHCLFIRRPSWPMGGTKPLVAVCLQWDLSQSAIVPWGVGVRIEPAGRDDRLPFALQSQLPSSPFQARYWVYARRDVAPSESDTKEPSAFAQRLVAHVAEAWKDCAGTIEAVLLEQGFIL